MDEKCIICAGEKGLDFGNCALDTKTKQDGFEYNGDIYKVKTFGEITKLEKNGMFAYESTPGTNVRDFKETASGLSFTVSGPATAQIIVGLAEDSQYDVFIDDVQVDRMDTGISGKLAVNAELGAGEKKIRIVKI